jgi:hypothetical protein
MPSVVLPWNALWSTLEWSARTITQCRPSISASWKSLRVSRIRRQSGGSSSVVLCRNANPLSVMSDEPVSTKLCSPVSTTPPGVSAWIVIGRPGAPRIPVIAIGAPAGTG